MPPRRSLIDIIGAGAYTPNTINELRASGQLQPASFAPARRTAPAPMPFPQPNLPQRPTVSPLDLNPTSGPPANIPQSSGGSGGGGWEGLASAGCDLIPNALARAACRYAAEQLGGGGGGGAGNQQQTETMTCPPGYQRNSRGECQIIGVGGYLPGDVGQPDFVWTPVNGRFGAGVTPIAVQTSKRVCPTGMILGKDGVCYDSLPRTKRAWNPGARPLLTGGDMNALRRSRQLQKKIGKIARVHGPKKAPRCAPKKRAR